jgi:hypothetical protein
MRAQTAQVATLKAHRTTQVTAHVRAAAAAHQRARLSAEFASHVQPDILHASRLSVLVLSRSVSAASLALCAASERPATVYGKSIDSWKGTTADLYSASWVERGASANCRGKVRRA